MPPGTVWPSITVSPPMPRPVRVLSVRTPASLAGLPLLTTLSVSTAVDSSTRVLRLTGCRAYSTPSPGCAVQAVLSVTWLPETRAP